MKDLQGLGAGFGRVLAGIGTGGLSEFALSQARAQEEKRRQQLEQQQQQRQQLGSILSGGSFPAFLRPGGAAELSPQEFRQQQLVQLGALGTPEATKLLGEVSPLGQEATRSGRGSSVERIATRIMDEAAAIGQPVDFMTALSLAKSGTGQGMTFQQGQIAPIGGVLQTKEELALAKETGTQRAKTKFEPPRAGRRTEAIKRAEMRVARETAFPKLEGAFQSAVAKNDVVSATIDEILPEVGIATAGFGSLLAGVPGTPAADLKANIDTILANVGFEELQAMRDNSPTGGALGQVAVRELELLQATRANITNSQSPTQLRRNLLKLKNQVKSSKKRLEAAFNKQARAAGLEPARAPEVVPTGQSILAPQQEESDLSTLTTEEIMRRLSE